MRNYQTIVVGIDFSEASERSLALAAQVADQFNARRLHLVHVVSIPTAAVLPALSPSSEAGQRALSQAETELGTVSVPKTASRVTREVRAGNPADQLARVAEEISADLVVVAGRGHSVLAEMLLGSVPSSLIRVARCPVLIHAGSTHAQPFQDILAAVDLSPISRNVLENAFGMANRYGATVRVLSLFEHPFFESASGILPKAIGQAEIEALGEEHRKHVMELIARVPANGAKVEVEVMSKAPPANVILDVARMLDADLIVLGTSGQGAWHRMILGSTANFVLSRASCPVLVVPHEVRQEAMERAGAPQPA